MKTYLKSIFFIGGLCFATTRPSVEGQIHAGLQNLIGDSANKVFEFILYPSVCRFEWFLWSQI